MEESLNLDANWNPRLLVHEMVHMWEGNLVFHGQVSDREYSDDLVRFLKLPRVLHTRFCMIMLWHIQLIMCQLIPQ